MRLSLNINTRHATQSSPTSVTHHHPPLWKDPGLAVFPCLARRASQVNQQNNFLLDKTRNVLIAEWDDTAGQGWPVAARSGQSCVLISVWNVKQRSSTICTATDMTLLGLTTWNRVTYYYPATTQYLYFKHFFCLFIHLIGSSICPTCLQLNDQFIEAAFRRQQPSICKIFECDNLHLKWDNLLMTSTFTHVK